MDSLGPSLLLRMSGNETADFSRPWNGLREFFQGLETFADFFSKAWKSATGRFDSAAAGGIIARQAKEPV